MNQMTLRKNTDLCNWTNISALFHYFQITFALCSHFLEHFVLQYVMKVELPVSGIFLELYNFFVLMS